MQGTFSFYLLGKARPIAADISKLPELLQGANLGPQIYLLKRRGAANRTPRARRKLRQACGLGCLCDASGQGIELIKMDSSYRSAAKFIFANAAE
jgi:hypothetical protein